MLIQIKRDDLTGKSPVSHKHQVTSFYIEEYEKFSPAFIDIGSLISCLPYSCLQCTSCHLNPWTNALLTQLLCTCSIESSTNGISLKCSTRHPRIECSKWVRYQVKMRREIPYLQVTMYYFVYYVNMPITTFLMIFQRFPTTFRRLPKIFAKLFQRPDKHFQTFPDIF